jgi:oxygen-independent coproporphyrinogen-3 oxidase
MERTTPSAHPLPQWSSASPQRLLDLVGPEAGRLRGLYVHVPFCFHKCHYCDFYSFVDAEDRQPAYAARLEREILAMPPQSGDGLETIFVGGGTPTFLRPELLDRVLAAIGRIRRRPDAEWTVEANPETVTDEVAGILVARGVHRVSLGAQSFDPRHLKTLERWHDPANVGRAIERLRKAGIGRINIDLIFGIPGSTLEDWERDLATALSLGTEHLSCYGLTYEANTAMTKRLELGRFEPCEEDLEAAMFEHTIDRLEAAGFEHYEISNFARPGEACRHNMLYWTNADWWALGPSASGHVAGLRWKNVPRISSWLADDASTGGASPIVDVERVPASVRAGEILLVGLRLRAGLDAATVERCLSTGDAIVDRKRRDAIDRALRSGRLEATDGRLRFTRSGLVLADELLSELV